MALRARHVRMRRQLVGDVLRSHGVADGAAEWHGIGVEIRLTAAINRRNREDRRPDRDGQQSLSLTGEVEVPLGIARERQRLVHPPADPLDVHADQHDRDASDHEYRRNEEDHQVAVGLS